MNGPMVLLLAFTVAAAVMGLVSWLDTWLTRRKEDREWEALTNTVNKGRSGLRDTRGNVRVFREGDRHDGLR